MQTLGSSASQPSTADLPVCSGGLCARGLACAAAGVRTRASRVRSTAFRRIHTGTRPFSRTCGLGLRLRRLGAYIEYRQERVLGHLDAPDLLHALLALLLALEQLALARDVAAVALGGDVLAVGLHRLARDHVRADRRLDRYVVLLARDALAQLLGEAAPELVGLVAVHDHAQRVDRVAGQQHVELGEVRRAHAEQLVVERR